MMDDMVRGNIQKWQEESSAEWDEANEAPETAPRVDTITNPHADGGIDDCAIDAQKEAERPFVSRPVFVPTPSATRMFVDRAADVQLLRTEYAAGGIQETVAWAQQREPAPSASSPPLELPSVLQARDGMELAVGSTSTINNANADALAIGALMRECVDAVAKAEQRMKWTVGGIQQTQSLQPRPSAYSPPRESPSMLAAHKGYEGGSSEGSSGVDHTRGRADASSTRGTLSQRLCTSP